MAILEHMVPVIDSVNNSDCQGGGAACFMVGGKKIRLWGQQSVN